MRNLAASLFTFLAAPCWTQPLPDEVLLLARIRGHAASEAARLANYTCLQTSRRYRVQGSKVTKKHRIESSEALRLEVAHVGEQELFSWPGAGPFENRRLSEMVAGGMTDTGSFSLFVRSIFVNRGALFKFQAEEDFQGRRAVRYDYSVSPLFGGYTIKTPFGSASLGYSGSFWADPKTFDLWRLTVRADDIPPSLSLAEAVTIIDYGRARIGDSGLVLPQTAQTAMKYASGDISENLTEYTHCRQFIADSRISFDASPENGGLAPKKLETVDLPPGLTVTANLTTAIDSETTHVGDALMARVETDVQAKRRTWLASGAVLNGRVRRLEKFSRPSEFVLLSLEFTDFTLANSRGLFFADFQHSDAGTQVHKTLPFGSLSSSFTTLLYGGLLESISIEEFSNRELPGVATFQFPGKTGRLPAGTRMVWSTRKLEAPH